MAGEAEEVAAKCLDVGGEVGRVLGAVDEEQGSGGMGGVGQLAHGVERAQHI